MSRKPPRFPVPLARFAPAKAEAPQREASPPPVHGLGLDSQTVRERMVARLRDEGIRNAAVLGAMSRVPRHLFVDAGLVAQAYENTALPIGHGQTISQPWVVARMIELLLERDSGPSRSSLGRVLEIGTGCGYQAALLAELSPSVISIERLRPLFDKARTNLEPLRLHNLRLVYGDGRLGHAPNAPYDSIICAAGGADIPPAWLEQLAIGGRLVAPTQDAGAGSGAQVLITLDRSANGWTRRVHEAVRFVPLRSGTA